MILISHRGNIDNKNPSLENSIKYIEKALDLGFNVEIDLWEVNDVLYLGHDEPQYQITFYWLLARINLLWVHCKNVSAVHRMIIFENEGNKFNYFWHENDTFAITSKRFIWAFPGKQPIIGSIAVMPEINNDNISVCLGVCSDNIINYIN